MFFKTARVGVLGVWAGTERSGSTRTASLSKLASHFLSAGRLDVTGALEQVADAYQISADPKDYIFTPVRANSVDVPNENGDAFSEEESLRFDHKIGRRVYQTYLLKPHHVNHRADNPRMARGVIVDVHYNRQNEMPAEWRSKYEASTGKQIPRDIFIEALLAVDVKKDPYLANAMKTGSVDAFSMGCECAETVCSVCANVATSRLEFCPHIRYGNKLKWFERPGDRKKVQAFEWCRGVVYSELSAVDQPADPRALRGSDVFQIQAAMTKTGVELTQKETLEVVAFMKAARRSVPIGIEKLVLQMLEARNANRSCSRND